MKTLLLAALCINTVFGNTMNITLNGQTFTATLADTPDDVDLRAKVVTASGLCDGSFVGECRRRELTTR
ncbi:hypothetical protein [Cardiobacterium valvarum]|uniref:Uncharacterized protein n=1 Tax=Cardiobacterium valvarum TaxID=194702 RepID=A0A381E9F3_9GAMM|nr:hypothetical protein [Cardiobacterium valvarum]SUX23517.1 Uncharacterised protein [Cardiobacterium valvarum]